MAVPPASRIMMLCVVLVQMTMLVSVLWTLLVPTVQLDNIPHPHRAYNTQIFPSFMNERRNDKGEWYSYVLLVHIFNIAATYILFFLPIMFCTNGSNWHMRFGKVALFSFLAVIWYLVPLETTYISNRGFLVCQYQYHSFPMFITVQLIPWLYWFCECVLYAHSAVVYRSNINGLDNYAKYLHIGVSVMSALFCMLRVPVIIWLLSDPKTIECTQQWERYLAVSATVSDLGTLYGTYLNVKFMRKSFGNEVSRNDWKRTHIRNVLVLFIVMTITFGGVILEKFDSFMYTPLLYIVFVPILFGLIRFYEGKMKEKHN